MAYPPNYKFTEPSLEERMIKSLRQENAELKEALQSLIEPAEKQALTVRNSPHLGSLAKEIDLKVQKAIRLLNK